MPYLITITEIPPLGSDAPTVEMYKRRVDLSDVQTTIRAIDEALNIKQRKPRSDKGTSRKTGGQSGS